jgi:flagellar assembly protein FliH
MRRDPAASLAPRSRVLRDVVLQRQPHALLRPAQHLAGAESAAVALDQLAHAAMQPAPAQPAYEDGLREGYDKGFTAGLEAAAREDASARDAAVREARERAVADGLREGRERAAAEAKAQADGAAAALRQAQQDLTSAGEARARRFESQLAELGQQSEALLAEAQDDMLALCHEVICAVLGQKACSAEGLRGLLEQARSRLRTQGQLAVHLHPDDALLAGGHPQLASLPGVQWVPDVAVELGGVLLRSAQGSVDARLEVQLAQLQSTLLAVRAQHRAAGGDAA